MASALKNPLLNPYYRLHGLIATVLLTALIIVGSRGAPKKWPNYRTPARVKCTNFGPNAEEKGRGTRSGYEASKGSKGISGL